MRYQELGVKKAGFPHFDPMHAFRDIIMIQQQGVPRRKSRCRVNIITIAKHCKQISDRRFVLVFRCLHSIDSQQLTKCLFVRDFDIIIVADDPSRQFKKYDGIQRKRGGNKLLKTIAFLPLK